MPGLSHSHTSTSVKKENPTYSLAMVLAISPPALLVYRQETGLDSKNIWSPTWELRIVK